MSRYRKKEIQTLRKKVEAGVATNEDAKELLELVDYYRKRIHEVAAERDARMGRALRDLNDFRVCFSVAAQAIDPNRQGLGYSAVDQANASIYAQAAKEIRDRVVAAQERWARGEWP